MTAYAKLLAAWALAIMQTLAPHSKWTDTFPKTADGMVRAALETPVFGGELGVAQTIALELAIAYGESGFRVDAPGDCRGLPAGSSECTPERANSLGLFQIGKSNLTWLSAKREDLVGDPLVQSRLALRLIKTSFQICAGRPLVERLTWYAIGGDGCSGESRAGRSRVLHAQGILARNKPPSNVEQNLAGER